MIYNVSCVLIHRSMCSNLYGIRALEIQGTSPTTYSYLDQKKILSKIDSSSTTLEEDNLPLNIPS